MDVEEILLAIAELGDEDLRRVRDAAAARLRGTSGSEVLERRPYGSGLLQLETKIYPGTGRSHGPYWYYRWREGGRQHSLYLGKTDAPEAAVEERLGMRAGGTDSS